MALFSKSKIHVILFAFSISTQLSMAQLPCSTEEKENLSSTNLQMIAKLAHLADRCSLSNKCQENGRSSDWDLKMTNVDLMLSELNRINLPQSTTSIGVFDSGIDQTTAKVLPLKISWKGIGESPIYRSDLDGHGSFVASRIALAAPGASVVSYPWTQVMRQKSENYSFKEEIVKACKDGNEIINLSLDNSESGHVDLIYPDLKSALSKEGCLLIKASSNDGKNTDELLKGVSNKILTVSSVTTNSKLSSTSNSGIIPAPGEAVLGYLPPNSEIARRGVGIKCSSDGFYFLSGTSFSAPLVAGMARGVLDVLKSHPNFSSISPDEKVNLLESILTSAKSGNEIIDGLKAVWIAESLAKTKSKSELFDLAKNPKKALSLNVSAANFKKNYNSNDCAKAIDCKSVESCSNSLRYVIASHIDEPREQISFYKQLLNLYVQHGEFELASHIVPTINQLAALPNSHSNRDKSGALNQGYVIERIEKSSFNIPEVIAYLSSIDFHDQKLIDKVWNKLERELPFMAENETYFRKSVQAILNWPAMGNRAESLLTAIFSLGPSKISDSFLLEAIKLKLGSKKAKITKSELISIFKLRHVTPLSLMYLAENVRKIDDKDAVKAMLLEMVHPNRYLTSYAFTKYKIFQSALKGLTDSDIPTDEKKALLEKMKRVNPEMEKSVGIEIKNMFRD